MSNPHNFPSNAFMDTVSSCFVLIVAALLPLHPSAASAEPPDPRKPWLVKGVVIRDSGEPMEGVEIYAHTGIGTLRVSGKTMTKADGTFDLWFAPGIWTKDQEGVQAATISPYKKGWFEKNLHRQGDLLAAHKLPADGQIGWGNKTADDVFLPGEPKTLKFVMRPAARISGILVDDLGHPLADKRVGVTGPELRPSSSVFAEMKTNEKGEFAFDDLPTGYILQIYAESGSNWRKYPNLTVELTDPGQHNLRVSLEQENLNLSSTPPLELLGRNTKIGN